MTLIATVRASDEIDQIWWIVSWVALILPLILGGIALTLSFVGRGSRSLALWSAVIGGLISLFPILFALHIYRIDFVAVGGDGTKASPPLLSAMGLSLLPLVFCVVVVGVVFVRRRSFVVSS